jgi:hypothetical protein
MAIKMNTHKHNGGLHGEENYSSVNILKQSNCSDVGEGAIENEVIKAHSVFTF